MMDVIYDEAVKPIIHERFPGAVFTDASDEIHEGRFEVILPDEERDAYFKHAIREGYYTVSLGFQVMMQCGSDEAKETIERWLRELKAEAAVSQGNKP
jgi:hypothetical protein